MTVRDRAADDFFHSGGGVGFSCDQAGRDVAWVHECRARIDVTDFLRPSDHRRFVLPVAEILF